MLDTLTIINGTLSLIYVAISIIIVLAMVSKYFKYKPRTILLVGIAWTGLCEPWLSSAISFLIFLRCMQ